MTDAIAEFCDFHHSYNDISVERRKMQLRVLRAVEQSVEGPVQGLTADGLRGYLSARTAEGAAPTTIRKELSAVRPFVRWMWSRRLIDGDRLMELEEIKPPRGASAPSKPKPYTAKEISRFWADLEDAYPWVLRQRKQDATPHDTALYYLRRYEQGISKWPRIQNYAKRLQIEAIVALALYGGIRREEIHRLELENVHPDNDYVLVGSAAKNPEARSHSRPVPWVAPMHAAVGTWLEFRASLEPDHDCVWLSLHQQHRLKAMHFRTFEMLLREIGRGYEFHRLRHTFATERLRAGMPLEKLQRVLGHSRIQQTLAYAELLSGDIVDASARSEARFLQSINRTRPEEDRRAA